MYTYLTSLAFRISVLRALFSTLIKKVKSVTESEFNITLRNSFTTTPLIFWFTRVMDWLNFFDDGCTLSRTLNELRKGRKQTDAAKTLLYELSPINSLIASKCITWEHILHFKFIHSTCFLPRTNTKFFKNSVLYSDTIEIRLNFENTWNRKFQIDRFYTIESIIWKSNL